jgi:hypothetical protein
VVTRILRYILCACFLLTAIPAQAQDSDLAKSEYQLGWTALKAKDFKKALVHYKRSYAEVPRPRTMYNIALCEEATGKYQAAVDHYQQFLIEAESRDTDFLALARAKLTALRTRIGAILRVDSDPPGASVRINGLVKGHTPLRLDMLKGKHLIRVSRKGSRSSERSVQIVAGENAHETFTLDPVGSVKLTVTPSEAEIRRMDVDDVSKGRYEANLSPGKYEFEVSLMGYRTRTISVVVKPGSNIQKRVKLQSRSSTGTITLSSDLSGANVTIDGIIVGSMRQREGEETPTLERRITSGNHVVIVEPRGEKAWSSRFHLSPGETLSIDLRFRNEAKTRKIARWGLSAVGTAAVLTGLTLGALAISDVRSDDQGRHDRGKDRAGSADILIGLGAVSLTGAWYLKGGQAKATIERTSEEETERAGPEINLDEVSLRTP